MTRNALNRRVHLVAMALLPVTCLLIYGESGRNPTLALILFANLLLLEFFLYMEVCRMDAD